jgi:ABC-type branched-subunit amino acid transport system substrate-binding protein
LSEGACHPAACAALALLLVACAGLGTEGESRAALRRELAQAVRLLSADPGAGREALAAFVDAHPRSPLAADAAWRLADHALAEGMEAEALARLRWLVRAHPTAQRSDLARLRLARLERARGDPEAAYRDATAIRLSLLAGPERREAHRLLADLAAERGDRVAQLRWLSLVRADQGSTAQAAEVDQEIEGVLARMDEAALASAAEQLGRRVPAGRIRLRQAELALLAGDAARARSLLAQAAELPFEAADAARLAALEARVALPEQLDALAPLPGLDEAWPAGSFETVGAEGTLGVVLPLSGSLAAFGEESLEGVLLAAGLFDALSASRSGRVRLVVRDTAGSPAAAAAAVRALAADPDVVAIVGPLSGEAAEAAARAAELAGVPLLALTGREEAARVGRFALRLGAASRIEAEYLADYAVRGLGVRRIALLYPDDAYGLALRAAFWDAAEARGAEVVGVARYAVDAMDFAEPIRRLIGYELLTGAERAALAERERLRRRARRLAPAAAAELREKADAIRGPGGAPLPPFVDFEALFIPDTHERVALIAPHLAFHEVRGVRLLGTSGWNHPSLIAIGGAHVEGAVFTASFHAESGIAMVSEFVRRFQATFEREPTFLAAQAFDAANLVLLQLVQGRRSREDVLAGILATQGHPGVSGVTSLAPDGNAVKRPYLLGIERGRIVSVDERGEPPFLRIREGSAGSTAFESAR